MTTRYGDAYNAIAREQARVVERALIMILDDEERHRRDTVLVALETMRQRLQERGVSIAPQEVLTVLEEATGACTRGLRLPRMLADARQREQARQNADPRAIVASATADIEQVAAARMGRPPSRNHPTERD